MAAPGECDAGQRLGQWRTGGNGMHAHSPFLARTRNYLAGIRRNVGGGRITSGASQRAILPAAERFRNEQIGKRDCCSNWSAFDSSHALELRGRDYRRHMAYHTGQLGLAGIRAFFHIHFVIRHQLCSYAGTPLVLRTGRFCHGERQICDRSTSGATWQSLDGCGYDRLVRRLLRCRTRVLQRRLGLAVSPLGIRNGHRTLDLYGS